MRADHTKFLVQIKTLGFEPIHPTFNIPIIQSWLYYCKLNSAKNVFKLKTISYYITKSLSLISKTF